VALDVEKQEPVAYEVNDGIIRIPLPKVKGYAMVANQDKPNDR